MVLIVEVFLPSVIGLANYVANLRIKIFDSGTWLVKYQPIPQNSAFSLKQGLEGCAFIRQGYSQGFIKSTPHSSKSCVFLVATCNPLDLAIADI